MTHAWMNTFRITNIHDLSVDYRVLEIQGLPQGDYYDKQMNQLAQQVSYSSRSPVALLRRDTAHFLAIPQDTQLASHEFRLTPHLATLVPLAEAHTLDFGHIEADSAPIAQSFLRFALQGQLWNNTNLWRSGRGYYEKSPINRADPAATTDIYPGFVWNVLVRDGQIFLSVDTTARYVDRRWLHERPEEPRQFLRRHCLYQFGDTWFMVQLWGIPGQTISQQRFVPNGTDTPTDVFRYTKEKCQGGRPPWIANLDPNSPSVLYRYPNRRDDRYGALALCKLAVSTGDAEAAGLHRRSILDPTTRFERATEVVSTYFQSVRLRDRHIQISRTPYETERRIFQVPDLEFGNGKRLTIAGTGGSPDTSAVPLSELGTKRLNLLLDTKAGPLDKSPFDAQYLLMPLSSQRSINEDFQRRLCLSMREVAGRPYSVQRVIYDDLQATNLFKQVAAIKKAISDVQITRGYALLVLPRRAHPDLHHYIKRALWPDIQLQCAMAGKIASFYGPVGNKGDFAPRPDQAGKLRSYLRNCALGMMVVNRKWLWALADPLHYDVYVGIDVLNAWAGFTFVYDRGRHIFFRDFQSQQRERLSARQIREALVRHLKEDLKALSIRPSSFVIHRDGRSFGTEITGARTAVQELVAERILPADIQFGIVDIRKTTADNLRLVQGESLHALQNPTIGATDFSRAGKEGIVCTTGQPFRFPGTANPLAAAIVDGDLDIEWVLSDIFALSQLTFTAPDKCSRLPITVKLANDFLEPIGAEVDEEEALYGSDSPEIIEQSGDGSWDQTMAQAQVPVPARIGGTT